MVLKLKGVNGAKLAVLSFPVFKLTGYNYIFIVQTCEWYQSFQLTLSTKVNMLISQNVTCYLHQIATAQCVTVYFFKNSQLSYPVQPQIVVVIIIISILKDNEVSMHCTGSEDSENMR